MIAFDVGDETDIGTKKIMAALRKAADGYIGAFTGAIYLFATDVATAAMRKTPVDTGLLRKSRYVTVPDGAHVEAGFSAPYAAAVHNRNLNYRVGEWMFLRRAFDEMRPRGPSRIAMYTDKLMAQGLDGKSVPHVHPTEPTVYTAATLAAASQRRARGAVKVRRAARQRRTMRVGRWE